MPTASNRLLIAILACVCLVLAPVDRAVGCGGTGAADCGACCATTGGAAPARSGCCSDPGAPDAPSPSDDGCTCHHAPAPGKPVDDELGLPTSVGVDAVAGDRSTVVAWIAPRGPRVVRLVQHPPPRAGPALHVQHCVFLI